MTADRGSEDQSAPVADELDIGQELRSMRAERPLGDNEEVGACRMKRGSRRRCAPNVTPEECERLAELYKATEATWSPGETCP